ncbi:MAG: YcaO-like family protein [Candidatus Dormibacteria bacterium]
MSVKVVTEGTHRAVAPEVTWERIRRILPEAGITRVADVTQLDRIGIPTFQAVRPASRNLCVSQGKGLTPILARVSAAMESIELWHAEEPRLVSRRERVGEILPELGYAMEQLPLRAHHVLHDDLVLDWVAAERLDGSSSWLPHATLPIDFTIREEWEPPLFLRSSNGLASGNTWEEAVLHAVYEVVERDGVDPLRHLPVADWPLIEPASIQTPAARRLLDKLAACDVEVAVVEATSVPGIPCYEAHIWSSDYPRQCRGSGAHLDPDVALCRALTEAAQSRLTMVAGARDDFSADNYEQSADLGAPRPALFGLTPTRVFATPDTGVTGHLANDLALVAERIRAGSSAQPLVVDLSREGMPVRVVRVIAPGMRFTVTGH